MKYFLTLIFGIYYGIVIAQIGTNPSGPPLSCDGWRYCENSFELKETIQPQEGSFKLVFYDEFEGDLLDTNNWFSFYPYGENHDGTSEGDRVHGESQVYLDKNVVVEDGFLHLKGKKDNVKWYGNTYEWSSGMINSRIPFTTYGKFEISCKIPCGKGWFAAFWMFGWGSEIDVFETQGDDRIGVGTINWVDGRFPMGIDQKMDFCNEFHKYSADYTPLTVTFFVDDILIFTVYHFRDSNGCGISEYPLEEGTEVCENLEFPRIGDPIDVIANLAVGGPFNKNWLNNTIIPNNDGEMVIDWIRVYQKEIQPNLKSLCISEIVGPNNICKIEDSTQFCVLEPIECLDCIWNYSDNFHIVDSSINCIVLKSESYDSGRLSLFIPNQLEACESKIYKNVNIGIPNPVIFASRVNECKGMKYLIGLDEIYSDTNTEIEWKISSNIGNQLVSNEFNIEWDVNPFEYKLDIELNMKTDCGIRKLNKKMQIKRCKGLRNICSIEPNPAFNQFLFKINNFGENDQLHWVRLFSINGVLMDEIIPQKDFNGQLSINTSSYPSGSYILKGNVNNYEISKLFVIIRR